VRFAFIAAEKAHYPVRMLCRLLAVSRAGFHAWLRRAPSSRERADAQLGVEVAAVFREHKRRYGSPRVHDELRSRGRRIGRKRVARLMRERSLRARSGRRRRPLTTNSRHGHPVAANLLARSFRVAEPNVVWVGDITYLPTGEGWLYLAVLLDLFSRKVVGYALSERIDAALVLAALRMALVRRKRSVNPSSLRMRSRGVCAAHEREVCDGGGEGVGRAQHGADGAGSVLAGAREADRGRGDRGEGVCSARRLVGARAVSGEEASGEAGCLAAW
jgi:hypothetical protein